jgi:hypothetical protein
MYYQIYDTDVKKVLITIPSLEEARACLRLYDAKDRLHIEIRPIFKDSHPLRRSKR